MGWLLGIGTLGLIFDSRTAMQGAIEGVELCLTAVIPSLLPFLCLSMLLTDRLWGQKSRLLKPLGRLFRLPEGGEALLIPGLLGGYPAGAACIGRAWRQGQIKKEDAERLLGYCSNPGPAFLFGIVRQQFSAPWSAWVLWGLVLLGAAAAAWLLPGCEGRVSISQKKGDGLGQAANAMGRICVLVILFRVGLCFLRTYCGLRGTALTAAEGLLELTNGCCDLTAVPSEKVRFLLAAVLLSLGGLCVALQTAEVAQGLSLRYYCRGKVIQALTAAGMGWIFLEKAWAFGIFPLAGMIFLKKYGNPVAFFRNAMYTILKKGSRRRVCFSERK